MTSDPTHAARKPAGGFTLVSGTLLLAAWAAYRRGDLRLVDLRAWFACLELTARRCGLLTGRSPSYRIEEIHSLIGGVGGEHIRRSLSRIEGQRLLTWSNTSIQFPKSDDVAIAPVLGPMLDLVPNHRRLVPVPRRIVRLIAGGARRVVIASIVGHLLRCLYYRGGLCHTEGTCKASWIAEVFGVNVRNVKAARAHLMRIGWLTPIETRQTVLNRFGKRMRVNLEWSRNDIGLQPKRSPRDAVSTTGSPPPYRDKKLSSRMYMNQKPEPGPAGSSRERKREGEPTLRRVVWADLLDAKRLLVLHREAAARGLISQSECDRLRFFAAAEHAKAIGTRNPCGLFATIVRKSLWAFITQDDEEAARRALKRIESGSVVTARVRGAVDGEQLPRDDGPSLSRAKIRAMIASSLGESAIGVSSFGRAEEGLACPSFAE